MFGCYFDVFKPTPGMVGKEELGRGERDFFVCLPLSFNVDNFPTKTAM